MKEEKLLSTIGKTLCGAGGAIVGFVMGGAAFAAIGIIPGIALGFALERLVINPTF